MFNDAFVSQAWEVRRVGSIKDINVLPSSEHEQMKRCMEIGLLCTQFNPADRPTMVDVLEMLNGKQEVPTPRKPRYTKRRPLQGVRNFALSVPKDVIL